MNILFMSLNRYDDVNEQDIYLDLLREFIKHGDFVYIISTIEKKDKKDTKINKSNHCTIVYVETGRIQKTNVIEKGVNTILLEKRLKKSIIEFFNHIKFDLIIYPTPPITFVGAVEYIKKRDNAKTFLLLKDIFPQNAIDISLISKTGVKGVIYRYFCEMEKELYAVSDRIGCMSHANIKYLLDNYSEIQKEKLVLCPNCIDPIDISVCHKTRYETREKYSIPGDKIVYVYGGNLGKAQGISFLLECLYSQRNNQHAYFLIIGSGTEYGRIEKYVKKEKLNNVKLLNRIEKKEYNRIVGSCDVGLIFLDYRFTVPNFPSRLLPYMQAKIPVLAVTDPNTDIGKVIEDGGFGWNCLSNDIQGFKMRIDESMSANRNAMGEKAWDCLLNNYSVEKEYQTMINCMQIEGIY